MAWTEAVTLPIVRTDEQGARDFIAERIVRAAGMTDDARWNYPIPNLLSN